MFYGVTGWADGTLIPTCVKPRSLAATKATSIKMKQTDSTYPKFYLYNRIVKAKLFIDKSFQDNIDLDNIADEAYFSKFHFIRLFKSIYNKTPHQYLTQVRIENAKHFLRLNYSVSDTCFMVGFDSITSFTGLFKKGEGKTPSEYQKQHRMRQKKIKAKPLYFIPNCFAEQNGWTNNSNFQEVL
jgi:AraC-like DNA-binding protein